MGKPAFEKSDEEWAIEQFGGCDLGDPRRVRRVVKYAATQVANPDQATHQICRGNDADMEGAYRMLRNPQITPEQIEQGPQEWTAKACQGRRVVLAIQDTTFVNYSHAAVSDEIGELSTRSRGIVVHSTLMVDGDTQEPIGIIDQQRWLRKKGRPSAKERNKRPYEDKESYKWQRATDAMKSRMESTEHVVTIGDRELDIYEYLHYAIDQNERFVARACYNRNLTNSAEQLFSVLGKQPVLGKRDVKVDQRGAVATGPGPRRRPARRAKKATVSVRAAPVTLRKKGSEPITLNAVYVREDVNFKKGVSLEWMLLTTEPITTYEEIEQVVRFYELRWMIEDLHKAWKTGCRLEQRRLQSVDNLERLMVILAPIAVRLLQLHSLAKLKSNTKCDALLERIEWRCLHRALFPKKRMPRTPPTLRVALEQIARLGGWSDSKRTGRIGWITLWRGWSQLQTLVQGARLRDAI